MICEIKHGYLLVIGAKGSGFPFIIANHQPKRQPAWAHR